MGSSTGSRPVPAPAGTARTDGLAALRLPARGRLPASQRPAPPWTL